MSTYKISPKIDTVVILGCFLMAILDFQPPFRPAHFYSKTYMIDHISLLTSPKEGPEVIYVNSNLALYVFWLHLLPESSYFLAEFEEISKYAYQMHRAGSSNTTKEGVSLQSFPKDENMDFSSETDSRKMGQRSACICSDDSDFEDEDFQFRSLDSKIKKTQAKCNRENQEHPRGEKD